MQKLYKKNSRIDTFKCISIYTNKKDVKLILLLKYSILAGSEKKNLIWCKNNPFSGKY